MIKFFFVTLLVMPLSFGSFAVHATTIDRFMLLQPIQVCDNAGARCASAPLSVSDTQAIYEQAGVAAVYLPTTQLNRTSLLTVDGVNDVNQVGNGQSSNATTLNVWFVDSLNSAPNTILFGEGYLGGNGSVINSSAVDAAGRSDTVAHEVGHNLGLGHNSFGAGAPSNVMTAGASRNAPASGLTQDQIDQIRASAFTQPVPQVTVDLRGSTPFQTNNFFDISFDSGPSGVSLTGFTIDLAPADAFFDPTDAPPGAAGSGLGTSNLNGISPGDLSFSGLVDGSQFMEVSIDAGAFTPGDSFAFGSDIDLFSAIDAFGATPGELVGIKFGFEFDIGLFLETVLDSDLVTSSIDVTHINQFFGDPIPFGPQVRAGQLPPGSTHPIESEPVPIQAVQSVPAPGTLWLLATGLAGCRISGLRLCSRVK